MSIWKKQADLKAINALNDGRANGVLGIRISEIGDDFIRAELLVEPRTHQPFGLLHGGVSCVLAETLGSIGGYLTCDEEHNIVGVDINATHMNSVRSGKVIGTARPLKLGRRMQFWAIDIETEDGRPVCVARLSAAVVPNAPKT
ncbi:MAG: hotdog fold thioesterase [Woeseia sp.]|nr:hotdog fold thioesterase [Woeseia sp.]MBT8096841.1 hotdog fold thioesterase [Woeseia sp.]NNL53802.1 hotdog fold thioesterase [Woeseia sp.]